MTPRRYELTDFEWSITLLPNTPRATCRGRMIGLC